jgi:hypothetical protein
MSHAHTLRFATAADVFEAFPTLWDDLKVDTGSHPPLDFLQRLAKSETPEDAITFAAYLLSKREAVWWACQSVRALDGGLKPEAEKLLLIAEAWVREPEEHRRLGALEMVQRADRALPSYWAAYAAGTSSGFMVVHPQPAGPVPPELTAKCARLAVLLALARVPVTIRRDSLAACVGNAEALLLRNAAQP